MKLKWYGHSCFGMTFSNGTTLITDPFDDTVGYPLCTARANAALVSHDHFDHNHVQSLSGDPIVIRTPGQHFVNGIKITGTHSFHDPEQGKLRGENIIYVVESDGLRIAHLGDLGHMPSEAQLNAIKGVDVMLIPIGGTFTITTEQALEVIAQAKPRCAIAMHFANRFCTFPITDETSFVSALHAVRMPGEIEITADAELPAAIVMDCE